MEKSNKNFALIGGAGYIAPRHYKAIKDIGGELIAACDLFDSVGILDSFFPSCEFFTQETAFSDFLKDQKLAQSLDYLSVCSPNHLHIKHSIMGMEAGLDVICEKPLCLEPKDLLLLENIEKLSHKKVYSILQLRLHPAIIALKSKVDLADPNHIYDIDLTYITSRGNWYHKSWKGDESKSGGIASNIGVHFFDMLIWIFGSLKQNTLFYSSSQCQSGYLELERARVRYFLSTDSQSLPLQAQKASKTSFRSLSLDGLEFEFSDGFTELHSLSYDNILQGGGYGLEELKPCLDTVYQIRHSKISPILPDLLHPFARF